MVGKESLKDPDLWIDRDTFAAYCGESAGQSLLEYYDKAKEKKKLVVASLNWFAILLLPGWFGYRRQWTQWSIVTGLIAGLIVFEGAAGIQLPNTGFLGGLLAVGILANGLLLTTAHGVYLKLKSKGLTPLQIQTEMKNQAAPSVKFAIAGVVGYLVIVMGSAYLTDLFFGSNIALIEYNSLK